MRINSSSPDFATNGNIEEIYSRETERAGIGADALADQASKTPPSGVPVLPPDAEAAAHGIRYFYQEEPGIYRGGVPFRQSGFDWLHNSKGVSVEIDLRTASEKPPTASMAQAAGIRHISIPMEDVSTPNGDQINKFFSTLDAAKKQNLTVFVHCMAGHYRSGIMLALQRIREGMSGDQAANDAETHGLNPNLVQKNGNRASDNIDFIQKYGDAYNRLGIKKGSRLEKTFDKSFADYWEKNKGMSRTSFASSFASEWAKHHKTQSSSSGSVINKASENKTSETTSSQKSGTVKLYPMPESGDKPLVDALDKAKKSIDLEVYMLTDKDIVDALKRAAKRGVEVRVMMEPKPLGSTEDIKDDYNKMKAELKSAGIQVKATPPKFDSKENVDHAKFMVIDGRELLFGTGNLVTTGLGGGNFGTNRDFWVDDKRAASAAEAEKLFNADWSRKSTQGIDFKNLVVTPDNGETRIVSLIDGAKDRLYVYNQEIYSQTVIDRLIAAKKRGVDVRVLVAEQKTNGAASKSPNDNKDAIKLLKAAGVSVKEFDRYYLHAKALVADNRAFIGSQNFSAGGLRNNRELGEVLDNRSIADRLAKIFLSDLASSK